ncbi:putative alpha-(1,6)-fucosyltransferase-like isoform X1 [Penaeus vannamei]|uniref:Putative alpha-(1,6)-fucosyltransferase-like isoform X1 n=1 Tax=Penaeus vannamei TaxID=6689 RepID=A0A423SYJ5_PENVA|nr:putative alpha-(1,6)-fucosyltransferase-like isoform X1 [Penaeus vannamei]
MGSSRRGRCLKTQPLPTPGTEDALVVQFPDTDRPVPRPNYLPRSVPRDFAERLASFHGDPFAWWMGQFMKYAMRMNRGFQEAVEKLGARLGFEGPVVGVQVRRTDKLLHDSRLIELEEYMEAVDDFYNDLEVRGTTVTTRKVYLATDDPQPNPPPPSSLPPGTQTNGSLLRFPRHAFVFNEESVASASMRQRRSDANMRNLMSDVYFLSRSDFLVCGMSFPKHAFVYNEDSVASANMKERRSEANIHNILADVYFLSRSDFLVCGMSSNICRLAYELMQTLHADASRKVFSVDSPYWFHYQSGHEVEARFPHTPRRDSEIELQKGDRVKEVLRHYSNNPNLHDGFIHGVNQRTRKAGLYPIYKTVDVLRLADTPPFDAIDRRDNVHKTRFLPSLFLSFLPPYILSLLPSILLSILLSLLFYYFVPNILVSVQKTRGPSLFLLSFLSFLPPLYLLSLLPFSLPSFHPSSFPLPISSSPYYLAKPSENKRFLPSFLSFLPPLYLLSLLPSIFPSFHPITLSACVLVRTAKGDREKRRQVKLLTKPDMHLERLSRADTP